jgi:dephospho-CoA kinase
MLKMKKIGITGGIGSGKSVVCAVLKVLGVPVYDADTRAKFLSENKPEIIAQIIENFGEKTFENGRLNRPYLASIIFQNEEKRQVLNGIVHPAVAKDFDEWCEKLPQNCPYALKEAALMIESGSHQQLNALVLVTAPLQVRIERIKKRDPQRSDAEIKGIIEKQMPDAEKMPFADFVLNNDGETSLVKKVLSLHQNILQKLALFDA